MKEMTMQRVPARLTLPGRILARELEARGWTQKDLATIMGRPVQAVNEIIKGTKQITPETALALADAFGTSAEFWLNLESNYRLNLARHQQTAQVVTRKSRLYSLLPMAEIIKRKWIETGDSLDELESNICSFLGIATLDETPYFATNFRQASERSPEVSAQIAWLARARQLALTQQVGLFDRTTLCNAIQELLSLSQQTTDIAQLPHRLAFLGVHCVIVPHLPKTYIDGATFLVDDHPVIALSLRYDRIDAFWFTLAHELAHICSGHQGLRVDNLDQTNDQISVEERQANELAGEWLIPVDRLENFIRTTCPHYSYTAIGRFAASIQRHPGIICGRLQRMGIIEYSRRKLLERVSLYLQNDKEFTSIQRAG